MSLVFRNSLRTATQATRATSLRPIALIQPITRRRHTSNMSLTTLDVRCPDATELQRHS